MLFENQNVIVGFALLISALVAVIVLFNFLLQMLI